MSINPVLGHLYHDYSFANIGIRLDAQEQLRTRQRNAREKKQLGKYSKTLERAKTICEKRYTLEEQEIRSQLQAIQNRTPSLERGLQRESERLSRYEESMSERRLHLLSRVSTRTGKSSSSVSSTKMFDANSQSSGKLSTSSSSRSFPVQSQNSFHFPSNITMRGNTALVLTEGTHDYNNANVSKGNVNYVKKAENITKSLHKLYRRKKERKSANKYLMEYVRTDNNELLMKARVYFKDTDAAHILEKILARNDKSEDTTEFQESDGLIKDNVEAVESKPIPKRVYLNELKINQTDALQNVDNEDESADRKSSISAPEETTVQNLSLDTLKQPINDNNENIVLSVVANPSSSSNDIFNTNPRHVKWSDNSGVPELWKLFYEKQRLASIPRHERKKSLVTLTARYRRSLVR